MDAKDELIIEELGNNARATSSQIAKKTRIPIATVNRRIRQLSSEGVISRFTITLNHEKIGKTLLAYIFVRLDHKAMKDSKIGVDDVLKKISRVEEIEDINLLAGEEDMLIKLRAKDTKDLDRLIIQTLRDIPGIAATRTVVVMREVKN
ncbi:Lrp/AsnC family transcriptional regulator [Candidatus Woesearchaeota archaeon]|nr:Lrp/AsnC family transcriptional regulator [Candidatus Woesearchaeota archaeon]